MHIKQNIIFQINIIAQIKNSVLVACGIIRIKNYQNIIIGKFVRIISGPRAEKDHIGYAFSEIPPKVIFQICKYLIVAIHFIIVYLTV